LCRYERAAKLLTTDTLAFNKLQGQIQQEYNIITEIDASLCLKKVQDVAKGTVLVMPFVIGVCMLVGVIDPSGSCGVGLLVHVVMYSATF
jgi:hypothetical protein